MTNQNQNNARPSGQDAAGSAKVGNTILVGRPVFIQPEGREWVMNFTPIACSLLAVLVEGPFRTTNDTFFRAVPARFAVSPQSDEVTLSHQAPLTCFLWMEFPVSVEQFRLWNPTIPLKQEQFQKLLSVREQYRQGFVKGESMEQGVIAWRNRFLQRNKWITSIVDYRRTMLDKAYEDRN